MEAIPLHLAATHIAADKVLTVAEEHAVAHGVDVWWREVANAGVACVLAVAWLCVSDQLFPHLHQLMSLYSSE